VSSRTGRRGGPGPRPGRPATQASSSWRAQQAGRARRCKIWVRAALAAISAVTVLLVVFLASRHGQASSYTYQVGSPGPGAMAPDFTLASNMGTWPASVERGSTRW
jgi:hypothetical protein